MGIYSSDGGWLVTVVGENDLPIGLYAPDGSYRVTTTVGLGLYAPNGALRINDTTTGYTAYNANGALNGQLLGSVFYPAYQNKLFADESLTLFARMAVEPSLARKRAIDGLITSLKSAGIWAKLDAFYSMAAHDQQAANLNWKSTSFTLLPTNSPVFTTDRGYTGGGSTFLNTQCVLSTATQYQLNSAHLALWSRTNVGIATALSIGARTTSTTNQAALFIRGATDLGHARMNQDVNPAGGAVTDSRGFFVGSRQASGSQTLYRNGTVVHTAANVSTAKPAFAAYILGTNTGGAFSAGSTRQYSIASIGAGLDATETLAYYNAINTYITAIGAQ